MPTVGMTKYLSILPFNFSVSRFVISQGSFAASISAVGGVPAQPASHAATSATAANLDPVFPQIPIIAGFYIGLPMKASIQPGP